MALKICCMGHLVQPAPKFLDSWESHHLSKAALKRSLNFSIFIDTTGTLILAHCVKYLEGYLGSPSFYLVHQLTYFTQQMALFRKLINSTDYENICHLCTRIKVAIVRWKYVCSKLDIYVLSRFTFWSSQPALACLNWENLNTESQKAWNH